MILFKVYNNYYKYNEEEERFLSYGKPVGKTYSVGSWFKCGEDETNRLKKAIFKGEYKVHNYIPGIDAKITTEGKGAENVE